MSLFMLFYFKTHYPKGSHTTWSTKCSMTVYDKIEFARNKCMSTIMSTETIPIA